MQLGVPKESFPGEYRVAIVPAVVAALGKLGVAVVVERGAGERAGFTDQAYVTQQATLGSRADVFQCEIVAQVRTLGANADAGRDDLALMRPAQVLIGFADPLGGAAAAEL